MLYVNNVYGWKTYFGFKREADCPQIEHESKPESISEPCPGNGVRAGAIRNFLDSTALVCGHGRYSLQFACIGFSRTFPRSFKNSQGPFISPEDNVDGCLFLFDKLRNMCKFSRNVKWDLSKCYGLNPFTMFFFKGQKLGRRFPYIGPLGD